MRSIEDCFRSLGEGVKGKLASERSPLRLSMAALKLAQDLFSFEALSAEEVKAGLGTAGVAVGVETVRNAFARAGRRVARLPLAGGTKYRLMSAGALEIADLVTEGNLAVLHVEGDRPRTDKRMLGDVLSQLSGDVRVCDPYYGARSLDVLEMIPADCTVRFVTTQTPEDPAKLQRLIADFLRERPGTQIRLYRNKNELHDRYILTTDRLLVLGHGLKDVGTRQSFIFIVRRELAPDLLANLGESFEERWARASPV